MMRLLSKERGSRVRAFVRAALVAVTAFGLKLDPAQVGAIQLVAEAFLAMFTRADDQS